jgi:hypothetical protein
MPAVLALSVTEEPFFCDKEVPLLAMREVFLCILASATRRHDAFNRLNEACVERPRLPGSRSRNLKGRLKYSLGEDLVLRIRQPNVQGLPLALEN